MDWTAAVDNYCERLAPGFWAEPVNAISNAAFLIAALVMWRRATGMWNARFLCVIIALIGIGSFLFHTFATRWSGLADVLPILVFILFYVWLSSRIFIGLPRWISAAITILFLPFSMLGGASITALFGPLNGSQGYMMIVPVLLAYAIVLRRSAPETAWGLVIGAVILSLSLTARTLDQSICTAIPLGTHYLWHLLNGLLLGWMVHVYIDHQTRARLAPSGPVG